MSNETKTKVVYEKIDWKEAEVGAAWKKERDGKEPFYFIKLNLSRWGVQKEVVLKGFKNKNQGNNPPTMRLYWLGEETQLILASQVKQQAETKPVATPPKQQEQVVEKSDVDF